MKAKDRKGERRGKQDSRAQSKIYCRMLNFTIILYYEFELTNFRAIGFKTQTAAILLLHLIHIIHGEAKHVCFPSIQCIRGLFSNLYNCLFQSTVDGFIECGLKKAHNEFRENKIHIEKQANNY
jgi:hypothetical protein